MEYAEERLKLTIEDLKKALRTLQEVLENPSKDAVRDRDAAIQRFEFTFELSWKVMKLLGEQEGLNCPGPRSAIRAADKLALIDSIDEWLTMLKARNQTTHTYNEKIAGKVYEAVRSFPPLVAAFLDKIQKIEN